MRVSLTHTTVYRFRQAVSLAPHRLMLTPRGDVDFTLISQGLEIEPAASLQWSADVFGNLVATATFQAPACQLLISSRLEAETTAQEWPLYSISPHAHHYPFPYSGDEIADLGALRGCGPADPQIQAWAEGFVRGPATDTLSLLQDLNAGIGATVAYTVRHDEGVQSAAQTLALRTGSCRDLTQLFITAGRALGFGGRAVSGYLLEGGTDADANATHVWAEVYPPGAGWIAFDPANGTMGNSHRLKVSTGRRSEQLLPVVGAYVGAPEDLIDLHVAVRLGGAAPRSHPPPVRHSGHHHAHTV